MRIIVVLLFICAGWQWSDWRNWRIYYPTVLFMMALSLLENVLTSNHKLWMMVNGPFTTSSLANSLLVTFTTFPATVLLYLSYYPQRVSRKIRYMLLWVSLYSIIEYIMVRLGYFIYANGWSLGWSVVFNVFIFPILRLHYKMPLLAWLCSGIILLFIWLHFGLSLEMLKDKP